MRGLRPLARRLVATVGAVAAAVALAAGAAEVRDDAGQVITLAQPARRIVSLAPNATELLYAVGAGPRIVGAVAGSDWPPEAKALPSVGDAHALDLERIVALAPDLVVTWPYTVAAQVAVLRARGIPVFTLDPGTIDGIANGMERLGELAGTRATAAQQAKQFRERLARLRAQYAGTPTVRVFYEIWGQPVYTIGGRHLITQALAACGGENVFAALVTPAPLVSVEAVLATQPDVIVAGASDAVRPAWLDLWKRWPAQPAVARGHLYTVDANLLHRAGPRFVDGVEALCGALADARR